MTRSDRPKRAASSKQIVAIIPVHYNLRLRALQRLARFCKILACRDVLMKKLSAVEDARAIMTEGMHWGVWKWLLEKKRVRIIADQATAALNNAEMKVKAAWSDELKEAYDVLLDAEERPTRTPTKARKSSPKIDPEVLAVVKGVKEADDTAETKRLDAEDTFDEAERRMSTAMAREGARKALETYDLHEKAIRKAEAAARSGKAAV